jgi:hypothetical protein
MIEHGLPIGQVPVALDLPCTLFDGGQKYLTDGSLPRPLTGG